MKAKLEPEKQKGHRKDGHVPGKISLPQSETICLPKTASKLVTTLTTIDGQKHNFARKTNLE